jgi:hypothetical protein
LRNPQAQKNKSALSYLRQSAVYTVRLNSFAVIGNVKAVTLEHNAHRLEHTANATLTLGAVNERLIMDGLAAFKDDATIIAPVYVQWHSSLSTWLAAKSHKKIGRDRTTDPTPA